MRLGFLVGVLAFPRPIEGEVMLKLGTSLALGLKGGYLPELTAPGGIATLDLKAIEGTLRWFPGDGVFFLGAGFGYQNLLASLSEPVDYSELTITADMSGFFVSPQLGVLWISQSGFAMSFSVGLQIPIPKDPVVSSTYNGQPVPTQATSTVPQDVIDQAHSDEDDVRSSRASSSSTPSRTSTSCGSDSSSNRRVVPAALIALGGERTASPVTRQLAMPRDHWNQVGDKLDARSPHKPVCSLLNTKLGGHACVDPRAPRSFYVVTLAGSEWSGVWRDSRGGDSEVRTIDHGGGDVEFQLDLWGGPPADNSGGMEGRVSVKQGKAAFETKEFGALCRIEFTFSSKELILRQALGSPAECGFGNRIFADGTFARTSRKVPTFIHR